MNLPNTAKVFSEDETGILAIEFSKMIKNGDVIILNGDLGTGKTFFVKALAKNFGIANVSSPTFAIVNEYYGSKKIYHFDFYRIEKATELFDIGINDYLNDMEAITFIEWGNLFPEVFPEKRIEVNISMNEDVSRNFEIKKYE
ncbi:MAG TPA: tRNA (adenosine(37)-N6)-threonylcarbamoyltransferase complex ATPase subunit type 1 TsaE [Ignavibacteriaceae bacterium]|nr:tRNA (adenosine(37)-N6)-threonylcarbamoyltransferase complex ATPase subunit type 1 TsaE [Ignavibacteriaceae bacterium]